MLGLVLNSCNKSADYLNVRNNNQAQLQVSVAVIVPTGDPLIESIRHHCLVFEGSEDDVLARYHSAMQATQADYVVRITSDCPLIPSFLISKMIRIALVEANRYDYFSNVDPRVRTALDGQDVEIISRKMLEWAHRTATKKEDREHVTTIMRREPPTWSRLGTVVGYYDLSELKLSVDTPEELEKVREQLGSVNKKVSLAEQLFGRNHVHRI